MKRTVLLRSGMVAALLFLGIAVGGGSPAAQAAIAERVGAVIVDLRIWQDVNDAENVWISARPEGGNWRELGTVPFPLDRDEGVRVDHPGARPTYRYRDLAIGGVEVRFWQFTAEPERFYIRACGHECPEYGACSPRGMTHLPLDDGHSPSGRYRYGDLAVAIPLAGPDLRADREHLLALRDTLAGSGSVNWSVSTATTSWEGVTVGGTPQRVMSLDLANRGLTGEMSGLLGNLTGLSALHLQGNALVGSIPSKLSQLPSLTHLYLGSNMLSGCVPLPLGSVANTDLRLLGLPDCGPTQSADSSELILTAGTYSFPTTGVSTDLVFDVPAAVRLQYSSLVMSHGADRCDTGIAVVLREIGGPFWLALAVGWVEGPEWRRSIPARSSDAGLDDRGDAAQIGRLFDRIVESVWLRGP